MIYRQGLARTRLTMRELGKEIAVAKSPVVGEDSIDNKEIRQKRFRRWNPNTCMVKKSKCKDKQVVKQIIALILRLNQLNN